MFDFNIITFHRSLNFGAVLQAFALQEFISDAGFDVGVYDYRKPKYTATKPTFRSRVNRLLSKITQDNKSKSIQMSRFEEFRNSSLKLNLDTNSRVFVTGSDQVWNLNNSMDSMFFLQFLDKNIYKASYAASMAKSSIPEDRKIILSEYLKNFDAISVREESLKNSLKEVCDKDISVNVDPTLLHDKSFYSKLASPIEGIPDKFILVYILHIPKNGNRLLSWLHKETGLPVVLLDSSGNVGILIKHNFIVKDAGPREFLYLFEKAECVVTTSFHGTCFSIIFEKEFYSIVNPAAPSRIAGLLNKIGIKPVEESDKQFSRNNTLNWEQVREKLASERQSSLQYFKRIFYESENKSYKLSGTIELMKDKCTGCSACEEICPKEAIHMTLNSKGFYEPVIDADKCINCGKCLKGCPLTSNYVNWIDKAYYGWNKSPDILYKSSSGGAFYSLASYAINRSGVVFGATYSDDFNSVVFECSDNISLEKLQKSKYTVSCASGIYKRIRDYLDAGKLVLFTGTPCQCAGIKSVFGDKYHNLITCDFVCGGMPSLTFYIEHLDVIRKTYDSEITSVDFRPKDWGWGRYRLYIKFKNGKEYIKRDFADAYFKSFNTKASVRHVCESCPYYHFHRSDFTIADFWGYRNAGVKKNKNGISLVVCNNQKASSIFNEISDFDKHEIPPEFTQYTIRDKIPNSKKLAERDRFFSLAESIGFEAAANQMYDLNEIHHYLQKFKTLLRIRSK